MEAPIAPSKWARARKPLAFALGAGSLCGLAYLIQAVSPLASQELRSFLAKWWAWLPLALVGIGMPVIMVRAQWRPLGWAWLSGVAVGYGYVIFALSQPFSAPLVRGEQDADQSLWAAATKPAFIGNEETAYYSKKTAERLNEARHGSKYAAVTYVTGDQPSTGPQVVSVNVIDDFTWGAAALAKSGKCLLIVTALDRSNPRLGHTRYGESKPGVPCLGSEATFLNTLRGP